MLNEQGACEKCAACCGGCDGNIFQCTYCADGYHETGLDANRFSICEECVGNCKKCDENSKCTECFDHGENAKNVNYHPLIVNDHQHRVLHAMKVIFLMEIMPRFIY